ncbi:hypothetical protein PVAND_011787 [Polypedilum vanderplanki]|uniref:G-protein coupled receptors family 1 profile domain-containing protein n=1 Tax=Polypedilum vanderplanki TaxID=319348 RepID=A0A9J6CJP6_POLVA|nr:hypothetical protein PVAND_011787 [Polypedilum vanderplanki]
MDLLPFVPDSSEDDHIITNYSFSSFGISSVSEFKTSNPYENLFKGFSPLLLYFASTCCFLFMLLGIPGNLFTIIALAKCKKVRNATAVFIINLSCSDLLFCCFNLPLAATTFYYREWVHGELMCRLYPLLRYGLLAVSLFSILTITINRYIMIGHPRAYPRIYRRRWLILMVSLTWICSFGTLIQTWRGKWGKFGMDTTIGSCSILPVDSRSPKEFLFVMAFILPCFAIVLCYARIFYIVRKTALKTHEIPKVNGSIKMNHNNNINNIKRTPSPIEQKIVCNKINVKRTSFCECNDDNEGIKLPINNDKQHRKCLAKLKNEDLKFIDTSCESDLPPTLSQLQRKSVHISNENIVSSPLLSSPTTTTTLAIISLECDNMHQKQLNIINNEERGDRVNTSLNVTTIPKISTSGTTKNIHDMGADSAVEDSTISIEQQNIANHLLSIPEPSSSSSGIELPYDQESPKKKSKKAKKPTKVKQKNIKDEKPPTDAIRKKSLANTSGASIIYGAARMSTKDRRLLKMILVIFISFLTCYLPITLTKIMSSIANINFIFITSYLLVYLTTCINPIIYVLISSEYRQAYKQLFICNVKNSRGLGICNEKRRKT